MAQPQQAPDPRQQIELVLRMLEGRKLDKSTPLFSKTVEWFSYVVNVLKDPVLLERLLKVACHAFEIDRAEFYATLTGVNYLSLNGNGVIVGTDAMLRDILPKGGWFEAYDNLTSTTESPLSFHIFSSMAILGAALGRRVFMNMGFFKIFPNYCVVLIGPTGRVKKTSAVNIAKGFIESQALCPIMADAITPEGLATALKRDGGHQFVYAPEFAVLFNRQKYNEALTTRIIRLLDCPETFAVETQGRGREDITNVALSFLGCSTPSLFTGATPEMVTSSGFLNRFILVVEEDTDREFAIPAKGERRFEIKIEDALRFARKLEGEMKFEDAAFNVYKAWYHQRKTMVRRISDEIHAEAIERGGDHLLRTAMLMHIAEHRNAYICESCFVAAARLLDFVEKSIPKIVGHIRRSQRNEESERVLLVLRKAGGILSHSDLLRKSRLDAPTFKRVISTLVESNNIREDKKGSMHLYVVQGEVDNA